MAAQMIALTDASMRDRIKLGEQVVAELNGVSKAIDGDRATTDAQLLGVWGNAHSIALQEINAAVVKLHGIVLGRNDALTKYLDTTQATDSQSGTTTTTESQGTVQTVAGLPTVV